MDVCYRCGESKTKTYQRSVSNGHNSERKIYVDDKGRQWNGHQCPDCRYLDKKQYDRKTTSTDRKCRACKQRLTVNYFYHSSCLTKIEEDRGWTEDAYLRGE